MRQYKKNENKKNKRKSTDRDVRLKSLFHFLLDTSQAGAVTVSLRYRGPSRGTN
jgi:hypothetical protein